MHVVESRKPLARVVKDLEAAVARHKFGVLGVHDLRARMVEKGVTFDRECRIFEVCNPRQANDGGIVRPSAYAVLRFITSSNFVGCSTGRSAGFAPLRILSA